MIKNLKMALRNKPYLPLYVQDFLTDEKLAECSAEATGVYIRLMCLMHKSRQYGQILLRQKDKSNAEICYGKNANTIEIFACKLAKQMPYSIEVIKRSLIELIEENVLTLSEDFLLQKRMVLDDEISLKRSLAGKSGMNNRYKKEVKAEICYSKEPNTINDFVITKVLTNTENENAYDIIGNKEGEDVVGNVRVFKKPTLEEVTEYCNERGNSIDPQSWIDHYVANGWKVGKNPMKDWKAAVRTWERNGITNSIKDERKQTTRTEAGKLGKVPSSVTKGGFTGTL